MNLSNKKLGIWGLGAVGLAAIQALHSRFQLTVYNQSPLNKEQIKLLARLNIPFCLQNNSSFFFNDHDYILPSPGIDLRPYQEFKHKFITELDLYALFSSTPTIGITGTIGKTTVTYCLGELLKKEQKVFVGGNIGLGLLQSLNEYTELNVFELSSFQLELTKHFAPELALITTLFPNHLDRHATFEEYKQAKFNLLRNQQPHQKALVPLKLATEIQQFYKGSLSAFSLQHPETLYLFPVFYYHNNQVYRTLNGNTTLICNEIPRSGFIHNWLIIIGALELLGKQNRSLEIPPSEILEHRLEFCGSYNSINFYNDSKSTIMESTLAAVNQLKNKPLILLIGGLSKGVDRSHYFQTLKDQISSTICFGKEAEQLKNFALQSGIPATVASTLPEAFQAACSFASAESQILLSPGGSSFDLYANYKERGLHFKKLVEELKRH